MKIVFLVLCIQVCCYGMNQNITYASFIITKGVCDKSYLISQINEQLQIDLSPLSELTTVEHQLSPKKVVIKKNKENFTFGNNDRLYVFLYGTTLRMYIDKKSMFKNRELNNIAFSHDLAERIESFNYHMLGKIHKSNLQKKQT